jgi:uncharacterized protein YpuA (DUF1002 family)
MAKIVMVRGNPVIQDQWDADDIMSVAENMDIELTEDQIREVMELIVKSHDANIGINWDVIGSAIDYVVD